MRKKEENLTVVGVEIPGGNYRKAQSTYVRLSNGMYLGNVKDISLNANNGEMWTVDVVVRTDLNSEQVLKLFGRHQFNKMVCDDEITKIEKQITGDDTNDTKAS